MKKPSQETLNNVESMSAEEMLRSIEKIKTDLESYDQQSDVVCKRHGMSRQQMSEYIESKANFSNEEWNQLMKAKAEVEKFRNDFWRALGKEAPEPPAINETKKTKKKRAFGGDKKKGWIPIP